MPTITVNLPESKDRLSESLGKQFAALQKQLVSMTTRPQAPSTSDFMKALSKQQDTLLKAMERLMANRPKASSASNDLLDVMRGLKKVMAGLPDDLTSAMARSSAKPSVTVRPHVTVELGGLEKRMDKLQAALVSATRKSRSRTFGSNY